MGRGRVLTRPRLVALGATCVLGAAAGAIVLGAVRVVTTTGTSMSPVYREGDLVVVTAADTYAVGQVVAYRDRVHDLVVVHRIIGGSPAGFELQGDHNPSPDVVRPTQADVIGRAVLHVPRAGLVLRRIAVPAPAGAAAAAVALALLGAGGTATSRRRRRRPAMSRHARRAAPAPASSHGLRAAAGAAATAGVLALAVGVPSWTTPPRLPAAAPLPPRTMTFSYGATVARGPAYDGTTVRSPDPVFRKLARTVGVRFAYRGGPGSVAVHAELSTPNGWRATVPLAAPTTFAAAGYDGGVRLDLVALERRALAAAAAIGLPADHLSVAVVPRVTGADGTTFAPALRLTLTPLRLALAGDPATLTVADAALPRLTGSVPRSFTPFGRRLAVTTGRTVSAGLLLLALLAGALAAALSRRAPADDGGSIRRRYAPLLVPVHPMTTPERHAVVDVASFATLAKLAERFGTLVLHWSRSDVDTYVVRDDGTTYRFRSGAGAASPHGDEVTGQQPHVVGVPGFEPGTSSV